VKKRQKGPSIKDVRSQEGRGLSSEDIFRTRRVLDADVRSLGAINFKFFELKVCAHGQRGMLASADKGGVNFFAILCGRLYGRPLNTDENLLHNPSSSLQVIQVTFTILLLLPFHQLP